MRPASCRAFAQLPAGVPLLSSQGCLPLASAHALAPGCCRASKLVFSSITEEHRAPCSALSHHSLSEGRSLAVNCLGSLFITASYQPCDTKAESHPCRWPHSSVPQKGEISSSFQPRSSLVPLHMLGQTALAQVVGKVACPSSQVTAPDCTAKAVSEAAQGEEGSRTSPCPSIHSLQLVPRSANPNRTQHPDRHPKCLLSVIAPTSAKSCLENNTDCRGQRAVTGNEFGSHAVSIPAQVQGLSRKGLDKRSQHADRSLRTKEGLSHHRKDWSRGICPPICSTLPQDLAEVLVWDKFLP